MSKFSKLSSRPQQVTPDAVLENTKNNQLKPGTGTSSTQQRQKPELPKATSTRSLKNALVVRIEMVKPNKEQVRKKFDQKSLMELAEDIREHGVLEPLIVRELEPGEYQIVAGERRYQAANIIGLTELPVIVRDLTDKEARFVQLAENLQRQDLDPTDEAAFFRTLQNEYNYSITDLAKMLSKSRDYVRDRLEGKLQKMQSDEQNSDSEVLHNTRQNHDSLETSQYALSKKEPASNKPVFKFNLSSINKLSTNLATAKDFFQQPDTRPTAEKTRQIKQSLEQLKRHIAELEATLSDDKKA